MSEQLFAPIIGARKRLNTSVDNFIQFQSMLSIDDERWRAIEDDTFVVINQFLNEEGIGSDNKGMDHRLRFAKVLDENIRHGINPLDNDFNSHDVVGQPSLETNSSGILSEEYLERFTWATKASQASREDGVSSLNNSNSNTVGNFDADMDYEICDNNREYSIKPFSALKSYLDKNKRRIIYSASILATVGIALFGVSKLTASNEDSTMLDNQDASSQDIITSTTLRTPSSSVTTEGSIHDPAKNINDVATSTTLLTVQPDTAIVTEGPTPSVTSQDELVAGNINEATPNSVTVTSITKVERGDNLWDIIESNIVRTDLTQHEKQARVLAAINTVQQDNNINDKNIIFKGQTIQFTSQVLEQLNS